MKPGDSSQQLYSWLFFAVISLVFAGVFAFLAAMSRTPAVKLLPRADYFQVSIVAHVIFSLVVWFLGFMGALWCYAAPASEEWRSKRSWGFRLALLGMGLIASASLLGLGEPVLIDYVPLLDHPLYFAGLFFIASGITVTLACYAAPIIQGRSRGLGVTAYGMLVVAAIVLVAFLSVGFSAISNGVSDYGALFWGPGHIIQFANTLAMVVVWFVLLEFSLRKSVNEAVVKKLMLLYLFVALALPMVYFLPPWEQAGLFTLGMSYGIGVPSFFLGLVVLKAIRDVAREVGGFKRLPWGSTAFSTLVFSLVLFGVGGAISLPGLESNLRVPAHYHGSLGAVTMAFMGMTYIMLRSLRIKVYSEGAARYQPYLYGLGLLVVILGLFWAGSYGAPRKAFGYEDPLTTLAMNVMGLGAIVAVLGGAVFVANTMLSLLKERKALSM